MRGVALSIGLTLSSALGCGPAMAGVAPVQAEISPVHADVRGMTVFVTDPDPHVSLGWNRERVETLRKQLESDLRTAGFTVVSFGAPRALLARVGTQWEEGRGNLFVLRLVADANNREIAQTTYAAGGSCFNRQCGDDALRDIGVALTSPLSRSETLLAFAREEKHSPANQAVTRAESTPPSPPSVAPESNASTAADTPPLSPPANLGASWVAGAQQPNAFALVVGVEHYRDLPAPGGARADAERFAAVAKKTLGVREANVRVALDERATRADLQTHLDWLKTNVAPGGKIYFFFSGHGAPDASQGTPYLLPYDANPSAVDQTAMPLQSVLDALASTRAHEVVAFVDSCFSGIGGRSVLPKGARPLVRVREPAPSAQLALFSAGSGSQISGPTADGASGLFTKYLVEGIGTAAADIDGDGSITLAELDEWVRPRVDREAKRASRAQTPSLVLGRGLGAASQVVVASGVR